MWDKFNRCSTSLALNTSVTEIGKQLVCRSKSTSFKGLLFATQRSSRLSAGCGRGRTRSWENSYFTPWGTFYLSWLHTGTSVTSVQTLTMWGQTGSFHEEAEVTSHGPKPAKEQPKLSCAGVRDKVTKFQEETLPSQEKLPILTNALTSIFLRLRNICIWRFH